MMTEKKTVNCDGCDVRHCPARNKYIPCELLLRARAEKAEKQLASCRKPETLDDARKRFAKIYPPLARLYNISSEKGTRYGKSGYWVFSEDMWRSFAAGAGFKNAKFKEGI